MGENFLNFDENFFMSAEAETDRVLRLLAEACEGLTYISETDAAVEPIVLPASDGEPFGRRAERSGEEEFFDRLTREREWHGPDERERSRAFARLRGTMHENLTDITVYRVGEIRIEIYVLGRTRDGTIAGVRTRAVET